MIRLVTILLALALPIGVLAADPPEALKVPPRPLDSLKLPPGTVIVITNDPKDTFQKIDAVVISPEEYKRLLDADAQLKKQANPEKPEPPSVCRLSGKVETRGQTEVVKLRAIFEFSTTVPKAVLPLGGRKAAAVLATLDQGKLPPLLFGDDGFSVTVESPGQHQLTIEWEVPLISRGAKGSERGFSLRLPGCPITLLEQIELPAGIATARLRGMPVGSTDQPPPRTLPVKELLGSGTAAVALGSVESVELFWDVTAAAKPADPLLVCGGDVLVRIDETTITATAALAFRSLTGSVVQWKLLAPPGSDVTVDPATGGEPVVSQTDDKSVWIIRTKEPGVEEMRVTVQTRSSRKPSGVAVGPFQLVGAFRQQNVLRVAAPSQLRPRFSKLRADVIRRAADTDGETPFAVISALNPAPGPWLFVDAEPVRGEIRTQISHSLTLTDSGWRLTCDIRATPIRTELDRLDVDLPAGLQDVQASPPELVETIAPRRDLGPNRWQIRLAHPKTSDVSIRLEGFYPVPNGVREAALLLPRPIQTFDRDGRVTVTVPDGWEARGGVAEWEQNHAGEWGRPLETGSIPRTIALTGARTPARVDLTWGRAIAEFAVHSTIDLTLDEQTAVAKQRLVFPTSAVPRQVALRATPGAVLQLSAGDDDVKPLRDGGWILSLPSSPDREQTVAITYSGRLIAKPNGTVEPGLVWAAAATRCDTRIRIWAKPAAAGIRPALANGAWDELPIESVPERTGLPSLVLHGNGIELPLAIRLTDIGVALRPIADAVFVSVRIEESGIQDYTARFQLRQIHVAALDFELPADILNLKVFVDGVAADSSNLSPGPVVRVPLANGAKGRTILLMYQRPSDRRAGSAQALWRWSFLPPHLRGAHVGEVHWLVPVLGDCVPLSWNSATNLQQRWSWGRILPELRPDFAPAASGDDAAGESVQPMSTSDLEPIEFTAVPRALWVAVCSLVVLSMGGLVTALRRRPFALWSALTLFALALAAFAVLRLQPAISAGAAALPGLVVLIPAIATQWALQRSHRRRIDHMPGFTRPRITAPSSILGSSVRRSPPLKQPSTVDSQGSEGVKG